MSVSFIKPLFPFVVDLVVITLSVNRKCGVSGQDPS
jgi:hypothetical protein